MSLTRKTSVLVSLLLIAACSNTTEGPPRIVIDRTACSHCGMLISEPIYAAAYQAPGSEARLFDDIGCLLKAARTETSTGQRFWFRDGMDGQWIEGERTVFVVSPEFRTPMGGGMLAYRDVAAAERAAAQHRGETVWSLRDLMARKGDSR